MASVQPEAPLGWLLELNDNIAECLNSKFKEILSEAGALGTDKVPPTPADWPRSVSTRLIHECDRAAGVLAWAYMARGMLLSISLEDLTDVFTVNVDWDVERYKDHLSIQYAGRNEDFEETLKKRYPAVETDGIITRPFVVSDIHQKVLLWYLPGLLSEQRQVSQSLCLKKHVYHQHHRRTCGTLQRCCRRCSKTTAPPNHPKAGGSRQNTTSRQMNVHCWLQGM